MRFVFRVSRFIVENLLILLQSVRADALSIAWAARCDYALYE